MASKASLLHLGSIDSFDRTAGGIEAAKYLLQAIDTKRPEPARAALDVYARITPKENFGGEYTALAWFAEYLLASAAEQERFVSDRFVAAYFHFFADNDFATLREYLKRKYKIERFDDEGTPKAHRRLGFLEDFILFSNPRREQWEKSSRMIAALGLKPGMSVADVGCGPGYFTFQFAELVGRAGRVYAIDTNDLHVDYVARLARRLGVENVLATRGSFDDIQLDARVDCAYMCSLYHIIYAMSPERSKDKLLASIKKALKPDGTLVVVDNALVEDQTLPYHGPYIAKELIIGQLRHYGFRHVATHQFIPQRYMLVFKPGAVPAEHGDTPLAADGDALRVTSRASLIHIPNDAVPDVSRGGREAARLFLTALEKHDLDLARATAARYGELIPREKFGDEYTAFQWFCEYLQAPAAQKERLLAPRYRAEYFQLLADNDFAVLKEYLTHRYRPDKLDEEIGPYGATEDTNYRPHVNEDLMSFWRDFILFNNPRREAWEKTSKIVEFLRLKPGQSVADVGCGPGFYSFKFAEIVGRQGRVFAVDTNQEHLAYVARLAARHAPNVETVAARLNDTRLPADSVDVAFMCSLYGVIYTTSLEQVKDQFVASIRKSLRKGGRLVIVDNAVVGQGELPYHGPYIAKELIVGQMRHYGFRLVDSAQFIPQRYVLVFEGE
jgi:ubiquinone/menaquinone biosynthesis C-methylase UbiE